MSKYPTWLDQIQFLFTCPYWTSAETTKGWQGCMKGYDIRLNEYQSVKEWSVTIYNHLHSRSMPLTNDATEFWPDEALEQLRLWINQGWRKEGTNPFDFAERIPCPITPSSPLRIRKDINTLTLIELNTYHMKLEEIGIDKIDPNAMIEAVKPVSKYDSTGSVHLSAQQSRQLYERCQSGYLAHKIVSVFANTHPQLSDQQMISGHVTITKCEGTL